MNREKNHWTNNFNNLSAISRKGGYMTNIELDLRIQKIADLLVDIVWDDNDILQTSQKVTNVSADKVPSKTFDPAQAEVFNYGSR